MKRPFSEVHSPQQPLEHPTPSPTPTVSPSRFVPSSFARPSVVVTSIDQEINAPTLLVRANGGCLHPTRRCIPYLFLYLSTLTLIGMSFPQHIIAQQEMLDWLPRLLEDLSSMQKQEKEH